MTGARSGATGCARTLIYTGKGGVGKTTTAAATAVRLARSGRRTLVLSTDPAHSLADVLGRPLADRPVRVAPGLEAEQLDAHARLRTGWAEIGQYLRSLLAWGGAGDLEAAELAVLPGLDEMFALLDLHEHATSGRYDVVVVDCAPTAETLRLLSLPDVLGWYIERLLPVQRRVTRALRPTVGRMTSMPLPRDGVFRSVESLYHRLQSVRAVLLDPAVASVRLVVNAERVVLAEARRTFTLLALFGYAVDAVIVNRLVPARLTDPFMAGWRAHQQEVLAEMAASCGEVPRLDAALSPSEPVGVDALDALAGGIYGARDPAAVLHDGPGLEIVESPDGHVLRMPLPGSGSDEIELSQRGDELYVNVGAYVRNVVLPTALRDLDVTAAGVADGCLSIHFAGSAARTAPGHAVAGA